LLDFEIARRKIPGDIYAKLPLITTIIYFPLLIPNSDIWDRLSRIFKYEIEKRKSKIMQIINECIDKIYPVEEAENTLRIFLRDFHSDDEFSQSNP